MVEVNLYIKKNFACKRPCLLKLDKNHLGLFILSWNRISVLTLGVAVAVRAIIGTPGNLDLEKQEKYMVREIIKVKFKCSTTPPTPQRN